MFDLLSLALGLGLGLIIFSVSWLLFQWPETRRLRLHLEDREDMAKELATRREREEQYKKDIEDRDRRLASMDSALAQANKEADQYQAMAKAAKEALEKEGTESKNANIVQIMNLANQGKSQREIQLEVFGYEGGAAYRFVKHVLEGGANGNTTQ
jgi:hypothetical protein